MATAKHPPKPKMGRQIDTAATGVIYARYSSHSQRDISIEQQIAKDQEIAEEYGIKIVAIYADRAVSGRTDQRREFQRMMRELTLLGANYVIAWKSNHMGRNMMEAMINEAKLMDMGVRVLYVEEAFDYSAAGRFAARSMMNVNQFYSDAMSEDIKRGMMDNAQKCMVNGRIAFGYIRSKDGLYEIDPEQASIVREIFTRFLDGDSFTAIANDLNSRGIRTKMGNKWNKGSFHRMLHNEAYIGVYSYGGIRKEGGVPPIISREVFDATQEKLRANRNPVERHRVNSDYILTGKLFCGHCGSPMVGVSGTGKSGAKHYYYTCQGRRLEKNCDKKSVRRDYIENQVIAKIRECLMDDNVIQWLVDGYDAFIKQYRTQSLLATYERDLEAVNKSIKNILRAIEQGIFTETTKDRLEELESERRHLQVNITAEKAMFVEVPKEQVQFWLESWRDGDVNDQKTNERMIDTFVKAIYLYDHDDGLHGRIVCNYTGKNNTLEFSLSDLDNLKEKACLGVRINSPSVHQNRNSTINFYRAVFDIFL